jgi:putative endonuclease
MAFCKKRFVYILTSARDGRPYIGVTSDVAQRLDTHNSGGSAHTAPFRPWRLAASIELATEDRALEFERVAARRPKLPDDQLRDGDYRLLVAARAERREPRDQTDDDTLASVPAM